MRNAACLLTALSLLAWAAPAAADDPAITASVRVEPADLADGEQGKLSVQIAVPSGWHLWSLDPGPGPMPLKLTLKEGAHVSFTGDWHGDAPHLKHDRGFGRELAQYEQSQVNLARAVVMNKEGASTLIIRGQICTDEQCLTQKLALAVPAQWSPSATDAPPAPSFEGEKLSVAAAKATGPAAPTSVNASVTDGGASELEDAQKKGVFAFMALAFLFGLGALATPCVFPAIPLTVSFFSKYSEESFSRGARLAAVYATTMVLAFTFLGVLLSVLFGVTGVQRFAAHPMFNFGLALVLIFFALNLLGLFEIGTPAFMLKGANALESKFGHTAGIVGGEEKKGGLHDYLVVGVAALTATTVFFTCTVAFVGLVLVAAAGGDWFWPTLGMLAFASAFALPFFLLAMFPQAAKRLRGKAGSWLSATRVTLGFLELAAATKFLSNVDLVWNLQLLTRELVLALWIPLFALCGFFLLGKLKIGEERVGGTDGSVSVGQMLSSMAMFALTIYLSVGLFQSRPFGGWLDGWLPPVVYPGSASAGVASNGNGHQGLKWVYSLEEGRKKAEAEGKLVFVNYTGYTCTNCRYMEGGVFPRPEIAELLNQMVLVELYTDGGTPEQDANRDDQVKRFKTAALPLYSVERANGEVLGTFPSSTNDVEEYRRFLAAALERGKTAPAESPKPKAAAEGLVLTTTRLSNGTALSAVADGKWTLINFWASWCAPCRTELEAFLLEMGRELQARGGHFAVVAVEEDESLDEARKFANKIGIPDDMSLRLPGEVSASEVDPRFQFDGSSLPYTVLVSPKGEIVWRHSAALTKEELRAVLTQHTGYASLDR